MHTICCYCDCTISGTPGGEISHGACKNCAEKVLAVEMSGKDHYMVFTRTVDKEEVSIHLKDIDAAKIEAMSEAGYTEKKVI